jgi:hypothetical protein
MNAHSEELDFRLPVLAATMSWEPLVDTAEPTGRATETRLLAPGEIYRLQAHSFVLFIDRAPRSASLRRAQLAAGPVLFDGERDPGIAGHGGSRGNNAPPL